MYARIVTLLTSIIAVTFTGCFSWSTGGGGGPYVPATITSFVDPAYRGHIFHRIAVIADTSDLEWRLKLEKQLAGAYREKGVNGIEGATIISPTRQWNDAARHDALLASGVDGYLDVEIIESGEWTKYIPATTATTVSRERKAKEKQTGKDKDTVEYEEVSVTTTTKQDGGYTERTPWTRYRIRLIDVATGDVAWMAMNAINGNPGDRLWAFCQEVAAQLQRDGLVATPPSVAAKSGN
jgi:hypothetical protein